MSELKTQKTTKSVAAFVAKIKDPQRRADSKELLRIFKKATDLKPAMWGAAIVGYGMYHYKSERSSQEGDWPLTGFSPRVQNMTVYVMAGYKSPKAKKILKRIGKHTLGGSCFYFKRLADIDEKALIELIKLGVTYMKKKYPATRP